MYFRLTDKTEYDDELKKYVVLDSLNDKNTDVAVRVGLRNATYDLNQAEKKVFERFRKSDKGRPNAKVVYNLEIHELIY